MTQYLPTGSAQMETLKRFFNMYFVAHDIMSRTAPIDYEDEPEHEWLENDDLDEVCNSSSRYIQRKETYAYDRLTQPSAALDA